MTKTEFTKELKKKDKRIEVLKSVVSNHRERLRAVSEYQKVQQNQYERVIKEARKQIQEIKENIPKSFVIYITNRFKKIGGGKIK